MYWFGLQMKFAPVIWRLSYNCGLKTGIQTCGLCNPGELLEPNLNHSRKSGKTQRLLTTFAKNEAGQAPSGLALFKDRLAVHKHPLDAFRQKLRFFEC